MKTIWIPPSVLLAAIAGINQYEARHTRKERAMKTQSLVDCDSPLPLSSYEPRSPKAKCWNPVGIQNIAPRWFARASLRLRPSALGFLCAVLAALTLPAGATTRTWLGATANWSNPDNWSPNGAPQNGDSLTFPIANPFIVFSMNNDLANLSLNTITFTGAGYTLNGNAITFIQGITDNHSGALNRVRCDVQFSSGGGRFNSLAVGQLEVSGTTTLANNQDLIVTALETNITVSGVIQGNGGLIKRGDGALFLRGSAANTFSGPTRAEQGELHLAKTSAARAISANVILDGSNPGVARLSDDLPGQYPPALSMLITNGGYWEITNGATVTNLVIAEWGVIEGSGLLTLLCDVLVSRADFPLSNSSIDCAVYLGDQSRTFRVSGTASLFMDGQIIGPGPGPGSPGITKLGGSEMYLGRPNLYYGPTTVQGGVLWVEDSDALGGSGPGAETWVKGGALGFTGATVSEPVIMQGGDIEFHSSTTFTGSLILSNSCSFIGVFASPYLEISGIISGPQAFSVESGTVRLSGSSANTFGSAISRVFVEPGPLSHFYPAIPTLELAKAGVTAVPVPVSVSAFDTNMAVLRQLQEGGVADVRIGHGGSWQLNGHIAAPSALTFTGDGYVDSQGGLLQLTNPTTNQLRVIPGFPANYLAGIAGRLSCTGTTNIFIVDSNLTLNVAARVSGGASLVKEGTGTMRLSTSNNFTGPVTVNEGTLRAAHTFALGTTAAGTFVNNNASLALDGGFDGIEIAGETLTLNSTNAAALTSIGLPLTNVWSGNIVLQRTAGISVPSPGGAITHFGGLSQFDRSDISGPSGFIKSGPGALFITGLSGGNSYTGPTTVADGLLHAMRRSRSVSGNVIVTGANAVLRTGLAAGFSSVFTVLPAGASLTVENGAWWAMSPTNSETLSRLVGEGRLDLGSGGALTVSNSVSCTFSGAVSGSGALKKFGLATFHVTGQSPAYTGAATVFDGTYKVDGYFAASPVTVKNSSALRGSGAVGDVTVENGGVVRVDPRNAGVLGGSMQFNSVNFQSGGVLGAQFYGPHPTGGNDSLYVLNGVTLSTPALSSGFLYPVHEGDVITLVQKIAAGAVTGTFSGFPEGAVRFIGGVPVVASYAGGDGNDVTLTVTNLPLQGGGAQFVSGHGGSALVPNDCSQLRLVATNRGAVALTGLRGELRSLTDGVLVTMAASDFPNLAPNARGTNLTPFQIRTSPAFSCGAGAEFELVLTASNAPSIALVYTFVGTPGYSLQFDGRDARVDLPANTFSGVVNNFTIELWANPTGNRNVSPETNAGISVLLARPNQRFAVFPDRGDLAYGATHVSAGLSIGRNGISVFEHGTNRLLGAVHLPSRLVYSNAVSGWTHVALVYGSRQPRLYVNGTLVRSGAASLFSSVHPSGSLGGSIQADLGNYEGQLDEVRIWNVALDPSQIQSNMTRRLAGTEPNLVTYFRADEGGGLVLTDSAPASPNPSGTLANGAAFVLAGSAPITPPDADCLSRGGACESCFVVNGTFTTNTPTLTAPLSPGSSPSLCFPPKLCPGPFPLPLPPTPFILHTFTNTSSSDACVTAQLHLDCPAAPQGAMYAAAYLGTFDPNEPCKNYLGDSGGDGTAAFSFSLPAGSNVVIRVALWTPGLGCDAYTLELFGLPCPPPRLEIAHDATAGNVRVSWSSAYPDYRLQSVNSLNGSRPFPFGDVVSPPSLLNGKFAVTNPVSLPRQFFRLEAR